MRRHRHVRQRHDARQTERGERRNVQADVPRDVAERVAALVAVRARVGQLADADAVQHDDDGAREHKGSARLKPGPHIADARPYCEMRGPGFSLATLGHG